MRLHFTPADVGKESGRPDRVELAQSQGATLTTAQHSACALCATMEQRGGGKEQGLERVLTLSHVRDEAPFDPTHSPDSTPTNGGT